MEGKVLLPSIILFKKSAGAAILVWIPNKYAKKTQHIFIITFGWKKYDKKNLKGATNLCIGLKRRYQLKDELLTMWAHAVRTKREERKVLESPSPGPRRPSENQAYVLHHQRHLKKYSFSYKGSSYMPCQCTPRLHILDKGALITEPWFYHLTNRLCHLHNSPNWLHWLIWPHI